MGGRSCLNLLPCSTSTPCRASAAASSSRYSGHHHRTRARVQTSAGGRGVDKVSCSAASGVRAGAAVAEHNQAKVVIVGATKEIGRAAIAAVSRARGMELAGAIDTQCIGQDAGEISGMEEALEIPVLNDLTMVLGSIAQVLICIFTVKCSQEELAWLSISVNLLLSTTISSRYVIQRTYRHHEHPEVQMRIHLEAAAFGLSSIVYVPKIEMDTVTELSALCEKASMGCLVAPTLSIGSVLLQQAAIQASFHYNNVEIVESRPNPSDLPSQDAIQIANNISDLGQIYNWEDMDSDNPVRVTKIFGNFPFSVIFSQEYRLLVLWKTCSYSNLYIVINFSPLQHLK
ncbi:hypothetical protein ACQ4PT_003621 [Festuca glaucescens]